MALELTPAEEARLIEICEYSTWRIRNKIDASLGRKRLIVWTNRVGNPQESFLYNYEPTELGKVVYRLIR